MYRNGAGEYISRLLEESEAGSAGEVFNRIPPEIGRCKIWERRTKQGVSAMDWEMYYEQDIWVQKNRRLPMDAVQMIFFLNQGLAWEMGEPAHRVRVERGEACMYRDTSLPSSAWYQGGVGFRFKSIQIPREYFQYIEQGHLGMKEMDLADRMLRSFTKIAITPYMYRLLQELEQADQFCGGIGAIYLEGKILEMIAACLDSCLDMGGGSGGVTGSRTDREVILEIRHRIDRDSANVPDCGTLAREAGISVSKLTKGFRELSGKPLHAYVIDRRLEYAAFLLTENRLNVSQAAMYAGYSNMSHFSAAFRKKYGVLPKDYIKGHWEG